MAIRKDQTLVFIGDSITDCGRRGEHAPLGSGYVKLFADMHRIRRPAGKINVINRGIGGATVTGLWGRWHDDVIRNRPDLLSVKIGINDLHRTLRGDVDPVPPDRYREAYTDILRRTQEALPACRILLIDPFYISTDKASDSFRCLVLEKLPAYLRIVKDLSRTFGKLLIRTHALFQRLLRHYEPETFCPEPVHPNLTGHLVIADAVYAALTES